MPEEKRKPSNIYQRILGIMADLHYIQKGDKMVNGQYKYVSHDQVTAAIHPMLVKHGIVTLPTVKDKRQEGNRTEVDLLVYFVNVDDPTDQFSVLSFGYGVDSGDKGPGKAISYAFKMACLKTFCLETGEDPDQNAEAAYEPVKCLDFDLALPGDLTDKERERLKKFLEYSATCMNKHVEVVKAEAVSRMPDFIKAFKNWKPKKEDV